MSRYKLTPEQEEFLNENTEELNCFAWPEEGLGPQASHQNSLYNLVWEKVWPRLFRERINDNGAQLPWSFFRSLEIEWNREAPHPPAFQALANLPLAAKFKPHDFILSQHENIVAKILVGSVAWWFAPCPPSQSTKSLNFVRPSDDLITSLVKYDMCFLKKSSVVYALEGLYSRFKQSAFEVFNYDFMQGQIEHSLRREREKQDRIKVETEEREARAKENKKLELERQKKKEEEETAKRKRQEELYRKGGRAISNWLVGEVTKFIEEAKREGFEELFKSWWQDAEQLKGQVAEMRGDNMTYRVSKIISILKEAAQLAEIHG